MHNGSWMYKCELAFRFSNDQCHSNETKHSLPTSPYQWRWSSDQSGMQASCYLPLLSAFSHSNGHCEYTERERERERERITSVFNNSTLILC